MKLCKICLEKGIEKKSSAREMCNSHYMLWYRYKDPYRKPVKKEKHGMYSTLEYSSWQHLKDRCLNPNNDSFSYYGGRGITVHKKWVDSFIDFYNYIGSAPSEKHTVDRLDPNGNYEPGNVKWSDKTEQSINTRLRSDNKSGYKGVLFKKKQNKYGAYITIKSKQKWLGVFNTKEEAIKARKEAEEKYWGI
jgi:hypothetical protein